MNDAEVIHIQTLSAYLGISKIEKTVTYILPQVLDFNQNNATFTFELLQNMLPISTSGSSDTSLLIT
jgi:hypothetical protein